MEKDTDNLKQSKCYEKLNEDEATLISLMHNVAYCTTADRIYKTSVLSERKKTLTKSFSSIDFRYVSEKVLQLCGFCLWDENHKDYRLIPIWIFEFIPTGTKLLAIDEEIVEMSPELNKDIRFGCVAFMLKVR